MMKTKTFEYMGQMVNYFNKVRNNPNIKYASAGYEVELGCYVVRYLF